MSMEGLRKGAQNISNRNNNKGSSRSAYYARWKPPQIAIGAGMGKDRQTFDLRPFLAAPPHEESRLEAAEPIVLIGGSYDDMYATDANGARIMPAPKTEGLHFRIHNANVFIQPKKPGQKGFNSFREIVCSAGPEPHAPQPCLGCYRVDHGEKELKPRDNWAFNIAHLGWYHWKPLVKDGQVQMKKDGSGPVLVKEECLSYKMENVLLGRAVQGGRVGNSTIANKFETCESCTAQHQFVFGHHRVLQVGFKHLKDILETDESVGKRCVNCGTSILLIAFDCANCSKELVDLAQSGWTNDQIAQFAKSPYSCQHCGHNDAPKGVYECGFDENFRQVSQACSNPQKTTLFDCVVWVQREGEATESSIVVKKVELIRDYKTQDGRPLSEHLKEIVKEPYNLAEMYKADSVDEQSKVLEMQNPYVQTQQQYTNYGQPGAQAGGPAAPTFPGVPMPGRPNFGK
jgi:DNA-directed RNA polymerase subunit RPC12/RpoP